MAGKRKHKNKGGISSRVIFGFGVAPLLISKLGSQWESHSRHSVQKNAHREVGWAEL